MRVRIGLLIEVLILFFIGAYSIADGVRLLIAGKLKLYDVLGPGWYNIGMGTLLLVAGAAYLFSRLRVTKIIKQKEKFTVANRLQMIYMIICLFIYAGLIELVGYLAASIIFFAIIPKIAGIKTWRNSILIGLCMTIVFYYVFTKWLDVIFPQGLIFNLG